jgi:hypothetical protein
MLVVQGARGAQQQAAQLGAALLEAAGRPIYEREKIVTRVNQYGEPEAVRSKVSISPMVIGGGLAAGALALYIAGLGVRPVQHDVIVPNKLAPGEVGPPGSHTVTKTTLAIVERPRSILGASGQGVLAGPLGWTWDDILFRPIWARGRG